MPVHVVPFVAADDLCCEVALLGKPPSFSVSRFLYLPGEASLKGIPELTIAKFLSEERNALDVIYSAFYSNKVQALASRHLSDDDDDSAGLVNST